MNKSGTNKLKKDQEIGINFQRSFKLQTDYEIIKQRLHQMLGKYLDKAELLKSTFGVRSTAPIFLTFDDSAQTITYTTERLIPSPRTNLPRPRIMLLFSNPHPHSIRQGMFLSPNTRGQENLFWPVMDKAGWLPIPKGDRTPPEKLAEICLNVAYTGPFELIFYTYYAFPTDYPEDIRTIFGKEFFQQQIAPEAAREFAETIHTSGVQAVVTFNMGIFNLVTEEPVKRSIKPLMEGKVIQSQVKGCGVSMPIFLTYPTGWRYAKDYMKYRIDSLKLIQTAILSGELLSGQK